MMTEPERRAFEIVDGLAELAGHVGEGWTGRRVGTHSWNIGWELTGPDGESLRVGVDEGRITVRADRPVGLEVWLATKDMHRRITLSPAKSLPQLARDIRRRVLEPYRAGLDEAWKRQAEFEREVADRDALVVQLADVLAPLGALTQWQHGNSNPSISAGEYDDVGSVTIKDLTPSARYAEAVALRVPRGRLVDVVGAVVFALTAPADPAGGT